MRETLGVVDWLLLWVWELDCVEEGVCVGLGDVVWEGDCVTVIVRDGDCDAVWLCVGVLLGEHTSLRAFNSIPPNDVSRMTVELMAVLT